METKKTSQANLENKRSVFLEIGLIAALSVVLIAFEWSKTDIASDLPLWDNQTTVEVDVIPITMITETTPPPPPKPKPADLLEIVKDDTPVAANPVDFNSEATPEMQLDLSQLTVKEEREPDPVYDWVDEMPEFPGGSQALMKYLSNAVRYPYIAQNNDIQGRVYIRFVVDTNGAVTNAEVYRGVDPSLDKEALRVVESMPDWKPGKKRGRRVKVAYTVPINFVLQTR